MAGRNSHGQKPQNRPLARRLRLLVGGLGGWRVVPVEGGRGSGAADGALRAADDDHHSPLSAAGYVALRVRPAAAGFRRRLPVLSAAWYAVSAALVAAQAAGVVLAHQGAVSAVAILSAAAAAVAAAAGRRGGGREEVGRLNAAAGRLEALLARWEASGGKLPVDELVITAETVPPHPPPPEQVVSSGAGRAGRDKAGAADRRRPITITLTGRACETAFCRPPNDQRSTALEKRTIHSE